MLFNALQAQYVRKVSCGGGISETSTHEAAKKIQVLYPLTRTHVKDPGMAWTSNNQLETHYITVGKEHTVCRIEENLLAGPPPYSQALGKQITMCFF